MTVVCKNCGCKRGMPEKVVILPNCRLCGSGNCVRVAKAVEPAVEPVEDVPALGETGGGTAVAVECDDAVDEDVAVTECEDESDDNG